MVKIIHYSNYNSFFEIIAALSSALIGFKVIQRFVLTSATNNIRSLIEKIAASAQDSAAIASQFATFFSNLDHSVESTALHNRALTSQRWLSKREQILRDAANHEKEIVRCKFLSFFVYLFFASVFAIIIGGMQQDGFVTDMQALRMMKYFIACSFVAFSALTVFMSYAPKHLRFPLAIGVVVFFATMIMTVLFIKNVFSLPGFLHSRNHFNNFWILIFTLIFYMLPVVVLLLRGILFWRLKCLYFDYRIKYKKRDNVAAQKYLAELGTGYIDKFG